MKIKGYGIPKHKRKIGIIYTNFDDMGNPLTYSVLVKLGNGDVIEFERNSRTALRVFLERKRVK